MALTHTMPAGAPRATRNQASRATEHDVVDGEDKRLDAELRADRRHQLGQQRRVARALGRVLRGVHSRTWPSVNQPARSSTRRASSAVRWP